MVKVLEENREYRDNYSIRYEILNGINKGEQDESYYDNFDIGEMVKHSSNIIDLIEEGDYVNGQEVVTVYGYDGDGNDRDDKGIIEVDDDYAYGVYLEDIKIYSILTKEVYARNCYKVEE